MSKVNKDIKNAIKQNNLKFWQVGLALGLNDGNFSRLLRKELTKDKKEKVLRIIEVLKEEQQNGN